MFDNIAIGYVLLDMIRNKYPDDWEKTLQFDLTLQMKYRKLNFTQKHQVNKFRAEYNTLYLRKPDVIKCLYYFYALNPVLFQSAGILVERLDPMVIKNYKTDEYKKSYVKLLTLVGAMTECSEPSPRFSPSLFLSDTYPDTYSEADREQL